MALTFEYFRGGEVLDGDTLGGSTMEYWRGGEVHQFFAPDSASGVTVSASLLNFTFAAPMHSTSTDQVLFPSTQAVTLATLATDQITDQILGQNVQNYTFNQPTPRVNPVVSDAKSSKIIIDTAIRL